MHQQLIKESQLKVLQLEHDLKLKEMKLQIQEMKSNSEIDEMKNSVMQLEMSVSKLAKEKVELIQNRDAAVRKCKLEVKQLEQELIDAKMESACFKSRLQEQQNKINRLKKQQQKAQEPKEGEGDTFVKIKEENPLVNPSNKMKSGQNSQNYVDHLMKMNDQKGQIADLRSKLNYSLQLQLC